MSRAPMPPPTSQRLAPRGRIYDSLIETIGNTPLVRLDRLARAEGVEANLLAKLEFFNPLSSVKDRIGLAMIEALEAKGELNPDSILVEPTSGNTGIALAFVAAAKGYRLILTMPESFSIERRKMVAILGAEIRLSPAAAGMAGAVTLAEEVVRETPGAVMPMQFNNPANPEIHRTTTAQEIWCDTDGAVDMLISGVGTGGTITGAGSALKELNPDLKVIAVEPEDSSVLSGGEAGPHNIQGIGPGFMPQVLDTSVIDEILTIGTETAFEMARKTARLEGMPVGISAGAAIAAAVELGQAKEHAGKNLVIIIPSFAERYLSTPLFEGL